MYFKNKFFNKKYIYKITLTKTYLHKFSKFKKIIFKIYEEKKYYIFVMFSCNVMCIYNYTHLNLYIYSLKYLETLLR